jgi:RNA polymerase sigma-70 factor, ECF subfamily
MNHSTESVPREATELHLVHAAIRNDRAAQDAIYDMHAPTVYRLAHRMCGDADMASDLTQDTFIRAFDRLSAFRHASSLRTWIHSIAVSVILTALRTQKKDNTRRAPYDAADAVGSTDQHGDAFLRARLYSAIDALPDGYRTVFIMYEIEGYSHAEIAAALGVEETTSQGQLFRARAKLRESLSSIRGDIKS